MAFVRTKRVDGKEYRQLVESYRENGKMRQRVLAHLGQADSLEAAIQNAAAELRETRDKQQALREERAGILAELNRELPKVMRFHGGVPPRYGEFHTAGHYGRITYGEGYRGGFPWYYGGYYRFMGICGRYWKIPKRIEKLEKWATRIEARLAKLKALV